MKSNTIPYAEVQLLLDWTEFSKHLSSLKLLYQTICYSNKRTRLGHRRLRFRSVLKLLTSFISLLVLSSAFPSCQISQILRTGESSLKTLFTDFKRETHLKNTCENSWYIFKYYTNIKAHLWLLLYVICHVRWSDVNIKCTLFSKLAVLQVLFYCSLPLFI